MAGDPLRPRRQTDEPKPICGRWARCEVMRSASLPGKIGNTEIDPARWKVIMHIHNRLLLRGGLVAGPLFIGSILIQGKTLHDYSSLRHPVSSLSLGPRGWMQIANFAVTGGLSLGFVVGLSHTLCTQIRTRVGPVLLGGAAIGILGAAAFPTDPVSGYPPGTPDVPARPTALGKVHDLLSVLVVSVRTRRSVRLRPRLWSAQRARLGNLLRGFWPRHVEHLRARQRGLQPEGSFC